MPTAEGRALYRWGREAARSGPLLEIGSYCGKSALYLGAAAREAGGLLFTIDHHRGSEEQQPGEQYHDPRFVESRLGRIDTLPWLRRTLARAGLEDVVVPVVGESSLVGRHWQTPLALVFIDGGHAEATVEADYRCWGPKLIKGGLLAIHDVFPDPADGGQAPFHVYVRAMESGHFLEVGAEGSLRLLRRR